MCSPATHSCFASCRMFLLLRCVFRPRVFSIITNYTSHIHIKILSICAEYTRYTEIKKTPRSFRDLLRNSTSMQSVNARKICCFWIQNFVISDLSSHRCIAFLMLYRRWSVVTVPRDLLIWGTWIGGSSVLHNSASRRTQFIRTLSSDDDAGSFFCLGLPLQGKLSTTLSCPQLIPMDGV
jgi:hypothetical protein